jgi:hypothetical protein
VAAMRRRARHAASSAGLNFHPVAHCLRLHLLCPLLPSALARSLSTAAASRARALVMRTSPRWTHRGYGLPQVAIRPQLSCHVTLGFSRHVVTVLVITLSYDIKTGRSWMRWKGDDDAVVLDLVLAPEGPWIILCDHVKVLRHLFGPT